MSRSEPHAKAPAIWTMQKPSAPRSLMLTLTSANAKAWRRPFFRWRRPSEEQGLACKAPTQAKPSMNSRP